MTDAERDAYNRGRNAGLEAAALIADSRADICLQAARNHSIEQSASLEAQVIAARIRALKKD